MNKEQNQSKKTNYIKIANRSLIALIICVSVGFLAGTNDLAIKHFVVQENKRKLNGLRETNTQLETKVMAMSSYSAISQKVGRLKMVKQEGVDYINLNTAVAKR